MFIYLKILNFESIYVTLKIDGLWDNGPPTNSNIKARSIFLVILKPESILAPVCAPHVLTYTPQRCWLL